MTEHFKNMRNWLNLGESNMQSQLHEKEDPATNILKYIEQLITENYYDNHKLEIVTGKNGEKMLKLEFLEEYEAYLIHVSAIDESSWGSKLSGDDDDPDIEY